MTKILTAEPAVTLPTHETVHTAQAQDREPRALPEMSAAAAGACTGLQLVYTLCRVTRKIKP